MQNSTRPSATSQSQLQAPHAFQLAIDRDFVAADPFTRHQPTHVPARTLLSQLL